MTQSNFPFLSSLAFGGTLLLAGCASIPQQGPAPVVRSADSFAATRALVSPTVATAAPAWPETNWWSAYGDSQLTALIEEGLAGAPDLAAAAARLRAARALE